MSSRASLRTAGNSRKSWEENDKWDYKSIIKSPFHSYIMMRKSELTFGFVCLILVFLNCSSFGRDLVGGSRVELDGLVFRRAVPAHKDDKAQEEGEHSNLLLFHFKGWTSLFLLSYFCASSNCRSNTCGQWWEHLYKSSEPIGLQSLSAEPWRARNGVLQLARGWLEQHFCCCYCQCLHLNIFVVVIVGISWWCYKASVDGCYKADLTSPSLSMLFPIATIKA